jgi:hypothetical protein
MKTTLAVLFSIFATACSLDNGLKIRCNSDTDCNDGHVCSTGICATPEAVSSCQMSCTQAQSACGTFASVCVTDCLTNAASGLVCWFNSGNCDRLECALGDGGRPNLDGGNYMVDLRVDDMTGAPPDLTQIRTLDLSGHPPDMTQICDGGPCTPADMVSPGPNDLSNIIDAGR